MRKARLLSLIFLLGLASGVEAQAPDVGRVADEIFARWNSTHTPGCAVGVAREGMATVIRSYGMADLETGWPVTDETRFESGSVAKQFTAAATVLLALDGKLSLDDPVRRYVPELPDYGRPLTIRHLLNHTSGLREWSALVAWQGWPRGTRVHTQAELLDVVTRQRALNYPVGDYYSYTNSGYGLLYTIVERVSGQTFDQFTAERLFRPLGMSHTRWRSDYTVVIPGRAQAYDARDDGWHLNMPFENVVGPGGLLTTVGDLLRWNESLTRRTLGPLADSLEHRGQLTSGREINYAMGLFVGSYRGIPEISHSGATAGYRTFLARYPDQGALSIAVLCNSASASPVAYGHALADSLIRDFPALPVPDTSAVDAATLVGFAGLYRNRRTHEAMEFGAERLVQLRSLPGGEYWLPGGSRLMFKHAAGGRPVEMHRISGDDTVSYDYMGPNPWAPDRAMLTGLTGTYSSTELGVTYRASVVNDTLTLSDRLDHALKLTPTYPDGFDSDEGAIWFTRDRRGRVTAFHVGEGRVWDLEFTRQ